MNGTFHEYIYKVVLEEKYKRSSLPDAALANIWGANGFLGESLPKGLWERQAMTASQEFEKICTYYCCNLFNKEDSIRKMQALGLPPLVLTEALEEMYNRRDEYLGFLK